MVGGLYSLSSLFSPFMENRESEVSPFPWFRIHPDLSPMPLDDPTADGQSNARTLILGTTVQPPEGLEDLLGILGLDANTVVFHPKDPVSIFFLEGQLNDRALISAELQGITDEILVELRQQRRIAPDFRQLIPGDLGCGFLHPYG